MPIGHHYQIAYVTRNIEKAVANFRAGVEIRSEIQFEVKTEIRTAAGADVLDTKLALIWVGDEQYEFIQPLGGFDIYNAFLPEDDSLRMHHICSRVDDWDALMDWLDRRNFPLVMEGASGPLKFCYADARAALGHYLEFTWMPDEVWSALGGR